MKKWRILPCDRAAARRLAEEYGVSELMGVLLQTRGFTTQEAVEEAFGNQLTFSDPLLMADMEKASSRVWQAVNDFEKIAVYGDYDADGVTATAMLYSYLESCGADVIYYIPERESEGYGMNIAAVEKLHTQGVHLIVTVDNGISSVAEVEYAGSVGMEVVITDHHRPRETLPAACAVVDPYRPDCESPFKDFSGVGVAFKLIMAMEGEDCDLGGLLENYADLVAIGTIGDVVPLTGENRSFVRAGLKQISHTDRLGLRALMEQAGLSGKPVTAVNTAFGIVPRINATGRVGSPGRAVQLLLSEFQDEAERLAEDVCADNDSRRKIEAEIYEKVLEQFRREPERLNDRVLVASGEGWHHGVIGIVASRVTEKFDKPSIIISYSGTEAKGSGRSVEGFSLFEAVCACEPVLTRFGGHPMAAGLSLPTEQIEEFRRLINAHAAACAPVMPLPLLTLDCTLEPAGLSVDLVEPLKRMEPFGTGNPAPLFCLPGMTLESITPVGEGKHLRLSVKKGGAGVRCMRFGVGPEEFPFRPKDVIDLAVTLEIREYNGQNMLSIVARDIRLSGFDMETAAAEKAVYEKYLRGEGLNPMEYESLTPNRAEFAALYRFLRTQKSYSGAEEFLLFRLDTPGVGLGKLLFALDVLEERGLISQNRFAGKASVTVLPAGQKVDLLESVHFKRLRGQRLRSLEEEGDCSDGSTEKL